MSTGTVVFVVFCALFSVGVTAWGNYLRGQNERRKKD